MDEVIRRFAAQRVRYLVIGGQAVRLADLIESKQRAGRPQDVLDAEFLQRLAAAGGGKQGLS